MILKQIRMICSLHHKRGEEVLEFNLNPFYFSKFKYFGYRFNNKEIPLICEGWQKIGEYYYLELNTSHGPLITHSLTYRIK